MLQAEGAQEPAKVKVEFDNFEHGFPEGFGPGGWGHLAYAIGTAFAVQEIKAVPAQPHDVALDYVLTEKKVFDFRS